MPTLEQKLFDELISLSVDIGRYEASLQREVVGELRKLERKITRAIKLYEPTFFSTDRKIQAQLEKLIEDVRGAVRDTYRTINATSRSELRRAYNTVADSTVDGVNLSVGVDGYASYLTPAIKIDNYKNLIIDGAKSSQWWSRQAGDLQFSFTNEMRQAVANGESIDQMVRRIRGTYNRATGEYVGGIMNKKTHQAAALARTSVINVTNQAKLDTYKQNSDVLRGFKWTSTLDSKTTSICRALDGLVWDFENKPIGHSQIYPGPTAHWGCRSTQIPELKGFKNIPKSKRKLLGERASQLGTGKVDVDSNYDSWFKRQKVSRQKDILGPKRYGLWRENKLSSRDLVNFNNRPLTIAELEKKYGKVA